MNVDVIQLSVELSMVRNQKSLAGWFAVSLFMSVMPIIGVGICFLIYRANPNPRVPLGIYESALKMICLVQAIATVLPCTVIALTCLKLPPAILVRSETDEKALRHVQRLATIGILVAYGLLLLALYGTRAPFGSAVFSKLVVWLSAMTPFFWIALGLSLNHLSRACELNGINALGMSSNLFTAAGLLLLATLLLRLIFDPAFLLVMVLPPIATICIATGFCLLPFAIWAAKMFHSE